MSPLKDSSILQPKGLLDFNLEKVINTCNQNPSTNAINHISHKGENNLKIFRSEYAKQKHICKQVRRERRIEDIKKKLQ